MSALCAPIDAPTATRRRAILELLWEGKEPFCDGDVSAERCDLQGWGSNHHYLIRAIDEIKPAVIIELGVWKGASVITMAQHLKSSGLDSVIIAVDTWLGSWEHWLQPAWFSHLRTEGGYPTLYQTFAANILKEQVTDFVVPLPLDSGNALVVTKSKDIRPDVLHIDAGHNYEAVTNDLRLWWPLLRPGGVLIGDDYDPTGVSWPGVREAFHDFFKTSEIENVANKCYIRKLP